MQEIIEDMIEKQEALLRAKQQQALSALLKRIQRDRNEQLKHRQIDSQRLIQRNKNLLLDLLNKQNMETRRTNTFLNTALGARSPGSQKLFKSRFHQFSSSMNTRLPIDSSRGKAPNTSYARNRLEEGEKLMAIEGGAGFPNSNNNSNPNGGRANTTK